MSNYEKLKAISRKYTGKEVYSIAADLDVSIKTDEDCLKDFNGSFQLNCNAMLAVANNRYIIYYKPCEYEKYYILHELCHYILKHNTDGKSEEQQSNILACMILIPDKALNKDIFTLSVVYNIPLHIVYDYIVYLKSNTNIFKKKKVTISVSIILMVCILFVLGFIMGALIFGNNSTNKTSAVNVETTETTSKTTETTSIPVNSDVSNNDMVYITKSGGKYHKANCYYIRNRNTIEVTVDEAKGQGYEPCAICFGK